MSFTDNGLFSPAPSWEIDDIFSSGTPNPAAKVKSEAAPSSHSAAAYEEYEQVNVEQNMFYVQPTQSNHHEYEVHSTLSNASSHPPLTHPHHTHAHSYSSEATSSISSASASSSPEHVQATWEHENSASSSPTTPEYDSTHMNMTQHHYQHHTHTHHTQHTHHQSHHTHDHHHHHSHHQSHHTTHNNHTHGSHPSYYHAPSPHALNTVHEEATYDNHTHGHQHHSTPSSNSISAPIDAVVNATPSSTSTNTPAFNYPAVSQYVDTPSHNTQEREKVRVKRRQKYTTAAAASEVARASVAAAAAAPAAVAPTPAAAPAPASASAVAAGKSNNSTPILASRPGKRASGSSSSSSGSGSGSASSSGSGSEDSDDNDSGDYSFAHYAFDAALQNASQVLSASLFTGSSSSSSSSSMPANTPSLQKGNSGSSDSSSRKKRRDRNISLYPPTGNRTKKMLEEFERIAAEALPPHASKRERNKLSASMYRKRRKIYLDTLEDKVNLLESNLRQQSDMMSTLELENKQLKDQLLALQQKAAEKKEEHNAVVPPAFTPNNGFQRPLGGSRAPGSMLLFAVLCCLLVVHPILFGTETDSGSSASSPMGRRLLSIEEDVTVYNDRYTTRTVHVYSSYSSFADSFLPFPLSNLDSTFDWLVDSFRRSLSFNDKSDHVTSLPVTHITPSSPASSTSTAGKGNGNNFSTVETPSSVSVTSCDSLSAGSVDAHDCPSVVRDESDEEQVKRVHNVIHHSKPVEVSTLA